MKYHINEDEDLLLIEISGDPKKNEPLFANRVLLPYLKKRGIRVIVDLKDLKNFDPIILIGVLNNIRKETNLLGGGLKICALRPEVTNYFKENRLDQVFHIYESKEDAKKGEWGDYGKR